MLEKTTWSCSVLLLLACLVNSQSCPPNTAMGLCEPVAKPCFAESDCSNGEICCPQACSRSCKPRSRGLASRDMSVPDLLNDPRVYVGKCPQASCYTLFGGESDECSTSHLCPGGQFCCNDGCRNVCQLTPEFAARVALEETRVKKQQQLIIQKQQEEMRRRQQEMYVQKQRQIATAERARQQAEARAAAEAELAAQHTRAEYEAGLRVVAQSNAVAALQQRMAKMQVPQQKPPQQPASPTQPSQPAGTFLDNFVGEPQSVNNANPVTSSLDQQTLQPQQQQQTTPASLQVARGYFSANKRDNLAGSLVNQINSPANANPYSHLAAQNINSKSANSELLSLIQPQQPPVARYPTSNNQVRSGLPLKTVSTKYVPGLQARSLYSHQNLARAYPAQSSIYQAKPALPLHPLQKYPSQPIVDRTYQSLRQLHHPQSSYNGQAGQGRQGSVDPFLMYHAMQTAA